MTEPQRPAHRPRQAPRGMSLRRLENIARHYIERFATTSAHLRKVLTRRAERARRALGGDSREMAAWIAQVVDRLVLLKLVDDRRYAADRAASLRRLGRGPGRIRALLAAKGIDRCTIEHVLDETAETGSGADASLRAALAYAKRRRFGVFAEIPADRRARERKRAR